MRRAAAALVVLCAARAGAHPLAPAILHIAERAPGRATIELHIPAAAALNPRWPAGCIAHAGSAATGVASRIERFTLTCAAPLAGAQLGLDGLAAIDGIAVVRVDLADGRVVRAILGPTRPDFTIAAAAPGSPLARGLLHPLSRLGDLLFLLALVLVVRRGRARLLILGVFAAAHGLPFRAPGLASAASLLALALEILATTPNPRRATWIAAISAVLHGLDQGGGAPPAFAAAVFLAAFALTDALAAAPALLRRARWPRPTAGYAIGALAAMWCLA